MRLTPALLLLILPVVALAEPLGLLAVPREQGTTLRALSLMVEGGTPDVLHVHATQSDRAALDAAGIAYTVLTTDTQTLRPADAAGPRDAEYHTPETISSSLRDLAAAHPDIARVVDVGTSWEGRELTGVVLTDQPGVREPNEPSFRVLGTHHGDEWSSMEVAWSVAWALADGYGVDNEVTELIDSSEVWIVPVVNPDGVVAFTRRNSRQVDLNRNYGFEWVNQPSGGSAPFSERESDAIRVMSMQRSFGHSISMHSGATNLGWVWNWTLARTDDDNVLENLCAGYLANTDQPDFWITNGAAWYETNGDTNDWSYGVRGGHDYTLEVSDVKAPSESELEQHLEWHTQPSVQFLLDGAASGARGRVTGGFDSGLEATIVSDLAPWPSYTDPETGAFSRPLSAGTHTLTVIARGHTTATFTAVVGAPGDGWTPADVSLAPLSSVAIEGVSQLSAPSDVGGEALICGTEVVSHEALGGSFALHRPGLGTFNLASEIAPGVTPCVSVNLDPEEIDDAWNRTGEWSLLLIDSSGADVAIRPLAVALTTPAPDIVVQEIEVTQEKDAFVLSVGGEGLPEGAQLRLIGPDAVRRAPSFRLPDGGIDTAGVNSLDARFGLLDWPDGSYAVRLLGGGEVLSFEAALSLEAGLISSTYSPVGDDDDDVTSDDDDDVTDDDDDDFTSDDDDATDPVADDDDDSASPPPSGCSSCGHDGASGTLALLTLSLPISRRRRRIHS